MSKNTTEIIYDIGKRGSPSPPENLREHIEWLTEKLHTIPEIFQDKAEVEISATTYHDCAALEYVIQYTRPETGEEEQEKTNKANAPAASNTPETDATFDRWNESPYDEDACPWHLASRLERENQQLKKALKSSTTPND